MVETVSNDEGTRTLGKDGDKQQILWCGERESSGWLAPGLLEQAYGSRPHPGDWRHLRG